MPSLTDVGFSKIVLLNGHYRNSHAWSTRSVVDFVRDMDDVHDLLEPRYFRTRRPSRGSR